MRNTIQQPEAGRSPASGGSNPSAVDRLATGQVDEAAVAEGRKHERTARPERPAPARDSGELTLAELAWTLVERRWSVIAVGATVLALTVAYLFVAPRVYESSILVQVGGRSQSIAAFQDLAGLFHEQTPTEGEMRILRSRTLLDAVVDELGLDLEVQARTMPVIGDALARRYQGAAPAPPRFGLTRFAWGGERIDVQRLSVPDALLGERLVLTALEDGRYRLAASDGTPFAEGEVGKLVTGTDGERKIELLVSELTARPGTEFTIEKARRIDVIERLQNGLQISEQGRHTGLMEIGLAGHDPARVAAILDAVSATYRRQSVERASAEAANTLQVLETQLPLLKANLEKAERSLNAFHRRSGTVNLSLEGEGMLQRLVEIDRLIAENEIQSSEMMLRYNERYPGITALEEKTRRLQGQRAAMEARMRALPDLELESTRLSRQLRVASELYMLVVNRAEELRIVKSGWIGNVQILERAAVPYRPVSPKSGVVLTLGLLLGLAGGIGVALIRNAFDRGARDPEDIERGVGLPVLATIRRSAAQHRLARRGRRERPSALSVVRPEDAAVEDLRGLRTSVQYALRQARNNVVGVTGLAPDAGKSFVSVNLAHLLAAAGVRVLLIDGDLRRGDLHRHFGVEAQPGLADLLSGATASDVALRPTGTPNLDLLPVGTLVANPSELLASDRLKQFLLEVGPRYGAVIVDTTPILSVADSALVGRHAGMNLLVVRAGEHSVDELSYVVKRLAQSGVAIRGAVLNDLRPSVGRHGRSGRYRTYPVAHPR
jgi:tyrosine-protein kinase Etk/Wzc